MSLRRVFALALGLATLAGNLHARAQEAPPDPTPVVGPAPAVPPAEPPVAAELPAPEPAMAEPLPSEDPGGELSAAELAELGLSGAESGEAVDTSIKFSGFMDFKFASALAPKNSFWRNLQSHSTMFMGNLNLYLSKNFTENIRTFAEVRFTYLPNGEATADAPGSYRSTLSADYADAARQVRWGGVVIERAYFEWAMHRAAVLRVGQYLTPYGIWNVDHGSPTIITVQRPFVIGQQLFPERQTGLQLFGSGRVSEHHSFGYALTVSNGMGPVSEYRDLDENKAVGGRVDWTYDAVGELRLGGSWFYGRDTSARRYIVPQGGDRLHTGETVDQQSDVLSLGADLRWIYKDLLVQAEFISQQRRYTDGGRTGATVLAAGNQYLAPKDAFTWGTYGLIGYRLPWYGVMPYFLFTRNDLYDPVAFTSIKNNAVQAGLNIRPMDAVVFKIEYVGIMIVGDHKATTDTGHLVQAQLAWAF